MDYGRDAPDGESNSGTHTQKYTLEYEHTRTNTLYGKYVQTDAR